MTIIKKSDRYPDLGEDYFPQQLDLPNATLQQARNLAEYMSDYYPGCEYIFAVVGDPEDE